MKITWKTLRLYLACAMAVLWAASVNARDPVWTNASTSADWGGHDYGCSPGNRPKANFCNSHHSEHVAVCWSNRATGWPFRECQGKSTWCTYKDVNLSTPPNGASPGQVWVCGGATQTKDVVVVPHEFNAWEQGVLWRKNIKRNGIERISGYTHCRVCRLWC